jgi:transcriptional antiterminator
MKKTINNSINKNLALIKLLGVDGISELAKEHNCSDRTVRRAINEVTSNLTILKAAVALGEKKKAEKLELKKQIKELK